MNIPSTLIIGYGNPDRQDDGVGWYILTKLAESLHRLIPSEDEGFFPKGENPDLLFTLQLIPELSETIASYERVCFIDCHTGEIPQDIHWVEVNAGYQQSPFTHHMTPGTCLALTQTLYGRNPDSILVSIHGFEFGFSHELSEATRLLAEEALKKVITWVNDGES